MPPRVLANRTANPHSRAIMMINIIITSSSSSRRVDDDADPPVPVAHFVRGHTAHGTSVRPHALHLEVRLAIAAIKRTMIMIIVISMIMDIVIPVDVYTVARISRDRSTSQCCTLTMPYNPPTRV